MISCQLGLTLSVVGPRENLLYMPSWPMALRITVGTADDPATTVDGQDALIYGTLPWNLWSGTLPDLVLVDQTGKTVGTPIAVHKPLAENPAFLAQVQASVEDAGKALAKAGHLSFAYVAKYDEVVDEDSGLGTLRNQTDAIAWPGLLMTVNTLASPTPSAAKSTWYFQMDRTVVAEERADGWRLKSGIEISVAPLRVNGATHANKVQITPSGSGAKYHTHKHEYDLPDVEAHCQALNIESVLRHGLDELDNYWLSLRDSRDDSLLDLVKRLEQALDSVTVLGSLSGDELAAACMLLDGAEQFNAMPADISKFMSGWKAAADHMRKQLRDDTDAVIKDALASGELYTDALRDAYRTKVATLLIKIAGAPPLPGPDGKVPSRKILLTPDSANELSVLAESRLLPQLGSQVKATAPGEGIELLLGDESHRLRHFKWDRDNAVDEIAAIQLFGRRSSERSSMDLQAGAVGAAPWYCLTASHYALTGANGSVLQGLARLTGVTAAYNDGILCREVSYRGANLVARNAMEDAHREKMGVDLGSNLMFSRLERLPSKELLAIPLRYGDWYEFAASVIDRAGGMAQELAPKVPWSWDPAAMAALNPPQRNGLQFLRRVPVGECSLRPDDKTSWPQTPAGVWLRCLELAESRGEKQDAPTILLAPKNSKFRQDIGLSQRALPQQYSFVVEPPRIDEHTLMRWDMPATTLNSAQRNAAATKLKAAVSGILVDRDLRMGSASEQAPNDWSLSPSVTKDFLPFDPAVSGIGLRWEFDTGASGTLNLPAGTRKVVVQEGVANTVGAGADFIIGPGNFLRLGFCSLVSKADFLRMDPEALQGVLEAKDWNATHIAFTETVAYAETATAALPTLEFDRIKLRADDVGDIAISYDFTTMPPADNKSYEAAHQIEIVCEQWKWRNLPLPAKSGVVVPAADRARRLASGPPPEIVDKSHRDDKTSELVSSFDVLSAIDAGFVLRPSVVKRFPRVRSKDTPVHVDSRDGHTHADYLRYSARLISRYMGVLTDAAKVEWTGPRRIATGFRGDPRRIKPPQILAVLPLTHALEHSPVESKSVGSTQFLVILDESWFREYGIGERIEARVATVKQEIGEIAPPTQLRLGPLPDHSVKPINLATDGALDCFGPFGMSLDRTGNQALANASAFVVYPPEHTPPHYNIFVKFRRVLDLPSGPVGAMSSEYTDAIPVYTLPDTKLLNAGSGGVKVKRGTSGITFKAPSQFTPFPGAVGGVLEQYRYALIAGRKVRDGGRAVDVFVPEDILWLVPGLGPSFEARWLSDSKKEEFSAGLFVEILLNGRYPFPPPNKKDVHSLSDATDLKDLFRRMLGDTTRDAPGMVRRVSAIFNVNAS
jgi:hypothetical protein